MSKKLNVIRSNNSQMYIGTKKLGTAEIVNEFLNNHEDVEVLHRHTKEDYTHVLLRSFIRDNSGPELTEPLKKFIRENFIGGTKVPEITTPELRSIIEKMETLEEDNTLANFNRIFDKEVVGEDFEEVFIYEPVGPSTRRKIKVGKRTFEIDLDTQRNIRGDSANATITSTRVGEIGHSVEGYSDNVGIEDINIHMD